MSAAFVLLLSIIIKMMTDFGSLRQYQMTFQMIFESSETLDNVCGGDVWRKVVGASEALVTQRSEEEVQKSERRI